MFGFTGTPIFSVNSGKAKSTGFSQRHRRLEINFIVIQSLMRLMIKNVLPFRVDYIKTMDMDEEITDENGMGH